jgi:hypothetical protein
MKAIFIRSPYFIEVDEANQVESKVELFIWNADNTKPTIPTYILSSKAASVTQTKNIYNISNYAKEFIDIINPTEPEINLESYKNWCYVKVKRYTATTIGAYTLLDTTTYSAFNGYTNYLDGYNNYIEQNELLLTSLQYNKKYKYYNNSIPYVNLFITAGLFSYSIRFTSLDGLDIEDISIVDDPTEDLLVKLPITNPANTDFANGNVFEILKGGSPFFTVTFIPECENKYTPLQCAFINRMGGWEFLTFFKARTQSWEVKNKEYQLFQNDVDYNPLRGESKAFNYEAKQSIKINTGWVEEYYNELIKDLMTSETILLDGKPVKLKTMTTDLKTSLQDKMINYQIEFEYNYNQINSVI